MKAKKFVGIFNLAIAVLLFAIIFLSSIYELNAFADYVNSLEESNGQGFAVLAIIVFMIFSAPIALVLAILTLIAGLAAINAGKKKSGRGGVIMGIVAKFLAVAGCVFLFWLYFDLYPAGWLSKAVYLLTAVLSLGTAIFDLCVVKHFKKSEPLVEEIVTETPVQQIATTEN